MTALAPENGVRVLLELSRAEGEVAHYRVELHAPSAGWVCEARLDARGVELGAPTPLGVGASGAVAPEAWMIDSARAFLRTLHKNHAAERDWPKRQLRWRERR